MGTVGDIAIPFSAAKKGKVLWLQSFIQVDATHRIYGPKIPYHEPNHQAFVLGQSKIMDSWEGDTVADGPSDGFYGELYALSANGGRTNYINSIQNTLGVTKYFDKAQCMMPYESVFTGMDGKNATGMDVLVLNNPDAPLLDSYTEMDYYIYSDAFIAPPGTLLPATFTGGISIGVAPAAPNTFYYYNVDLTTVPITMPAVGNTHGWVRSIYASGRDVNNNPIEVSSAQPGLWNTKPSNPLQDGSLYPAPLNKQTPPGATGNQSWVPRYLLVDGDGFPGDGTQGVNTYIFTLNNGNMTTQPAAYAVTRGQDVSTTVGLNTNIYSPLNAVNNNPLIISQRKQISNLTNQAEMTTTVPFPAAMAAPGTMNMLRAFVTCSSNATPLTAATCQMQISLFNNTTAGYDVVWVGKPPAASGFTELVTTSIPSGTSIWAVPSHGITDYIGGVSGAYTAQIKVGMRQSKPISNNWSLTIYNVQATAANLSGAPRPIVPALDLSSNL